MKRMTLAILLACTTLAWCQPTLPAMKVPPPSAEAIVQMGPEKFEKWCEQHAAEHMGSIQYGDIRAYYGDCLQKVCAQRMQKMPPGPRQQLSGCSDLVDRWARDRYEAKRLHSGGGSIYSSAGGFLLADLARLKSECVDAWDRPDGKGAGKEPKVPSFQSMAQKGPSNKADQTEYDKAQAKEKASLDKALAAVRGLPAGPRAVVWRWMSKFAEDCYPSSR